MLICCLRRGRKDMDLGKRTSGENLRGVERRETIVFYEKNLFLIKENKGGYRLFSSCLLPNAAIILLHCFHCCSFP